MVNTIERFELAKLIQLFEAAFVNLGPILLLYFIMTGVYTVLISVFRVNTVPSPKDDATAYPHLPMWLQSEFRTFRDSLGDVEVPRYKFWHAIADAEKAGTRTDGSSFILNAQVMIYALWSLWLWILVGQVIILLNLIIAVLSQAYDKVVGGRTRELYIKKAQKNFAYMKRKKILGRIKEFDTMILSTALPNNFETDEYAGFVKTVQQHVKRQINKAHANIANHMNSERRRNKQAFSAINNKIFSMKNEVQRGDLLRDK